MIRGTGSAEMVLRGRYHSGQPDPLVAERYARGGGQGCPDMPAAFAEVVSLIRYRRCGGRATRRRTGPSVETSTA